MTLTFLTLVAGAALGGGIATGVGVLVVVAVVALVLLGLANGARGLAQLFD